MAEKTRVERVIEQEETSRLDEIRSIIDTDMLTPLVRAALKNPGIEVDAWACEEVKGGIGGSQVCRVSGSAVEQATRLSWVLFLKILSRAVDVMLLTGDDWKREALAYEEGLLDEIPGRLRAPDCFKIEHRSENEIWMWLEDVSESTDAQWSIEQYAVTARHLGQMNGGYLTSQLPSRPWLLREFERGAVARDGNESQLRKSLGHASERNVLSAKAGESLLGLWADRERILANLYDRLPQTFGHMDSGRFNLFSCTADDGQAETVAIDWAFAGTGAIGQELKYLVFNSLSFRLADSDRARELYDACLDGYVTGLRDAEWKGDPNSARYGCAAAAAMTFVRSWTLMADFWEDESKRDWVVGFFGCSFDEMTQDWEKLTGLTLDLMKEASALEASLFT